MPRLRLVMPLATIAILGAGCSGCIFGPPPDEAYYPSLTLSTAEVDNLPTYTKPEAPPRDQQTQKTNKIDCPSADVRSEAESGVAVNFVKLKDGKCYWAAQFQLAKPDKCDAWHLHGTTVKALDGSTATDPLPGEGACGFGKLNTIQEGTLFINNAQFDFLYGQK